MNKGPWRATVHGTVKSQTQLSTYTHTHTHTHTLNGEKFEAFPQRLGIKLKCPLLLLLFNMLLKAI